MTGGHLVYKIYIDCFVYSTGAISNLSLNESMFNLHSFLAVRLCQRELRCCIYNCNTDIHLDTI